MLTARHLAITQAIISLKHYENLSDQSKVPGDLLGL